GDERGRSHSLKKKAELVARRVPAHVDGRDVLPIDDLDTAADELVHQLIDGELGAGHDGRGEDHRIARREIEIVVVSTRDAGEGGEAFALGAGGDREEAMPGEAHRFLGGDGDVVEGLELSTAETEPRVGLDGSTKEDQLSIGRARSPDHGVEAKDIGSKEGDHDTTGFAFDGLD